mmetsp:Transcript_51493/g.164674  ORF Transcript_51493/g.164674 Transcript_51493/m.164674 type:complete len:1020 (+) Transcript_51493:230-3289(+)
MSPAICALPPAFARATRGRVRGAETRTDLIGKPFHGANAPSLPARSSSHHLWGIRGHDLAQSAAEEGYSAGDNPEARKNPDLYSSLERGGSGATMGTVGPRLAKKPEVLAPCGGWVQLKAAVENGADCVYFGLTEFNARARAANFTTEELPSVVEYLHARGVKGYVTFNILVFDGELENAERRIRAIARAGVDAVIVQDVGVVELFRRVAPGLPVHGSTQMTITSAEGAEFARQLGVERVVVGRELSVREISKVREGTSAEVEAFVHGAMCVSYSGQCFSSEAWGGRSANRGQCAQACRMPYGLLVDGALRDLGDIKYLLSPQDLMAVERVPELVRAGVSCFKIEGRLKGPEYVALTTQVYRRAVDAAWEELTGEKAASVRGGAGLLSPEERRELELVFARGQDAEHRGLTMGFMDGVQHQELVRGRAPRHRGTLVGEVVCVTRQGGVVVDVAAPLKRGDGVVFDRGLPEEDEEGGSVFELFDTEGRSLAQMPEEGKAIPGGVQQVELRFAKGAVNCARVQEGDLVWCTRDPALENRLRATYDGQATAALRRSPVTARAYGRVGERLCVIFRDEQGREGSGESEGSIQAASSRPLDLASLTKAVGGLGDTTLELVGALDTSGLALEEGIFLPVKEMKAARRAAAAALEEARLTHGRAQGLISSTTLPGLRKAAIASAATAAAGGGAGPAAGKGEGAGAQVTVLCRSPAQVVEACKLPWLREVIVDFLEVQGLQAACEGVRAAGKRCVVATPRVLKPDEERLWKFYLRLPSDALLVRSAGMLHRLQELGGAGAVLEDGLAIPELHGDFSLNAANVLAAGLLLGSGLSRLTPCHDLNADQMVGLAEALGGAAGGEDGGSVGAAALECIVHQHLPIFHTEHCVFCRFLSDGNSYKDCGHPCEDHTVHLRDGAGKDHLVLADMGCRNTVFNAQAQSGADFVPRLAAAGYRYFRVELVDEPAEAVGPLLDNYRKLLAQDMTAAQMWKWLGQIPDANGHANGVSMGSLQPGKERARESLRPTARR